MPQCHGLLNPAALKICDALQNINVSSIHNHRTEDTSQMRNIWFNTGCLLQSKGHASKLLCKPTSK